MTACVFVGPTVSRHDVEGLLDARCLPPVQQGDVLRAVRRFAPEAIGIIDGLFGGAPAVWHKEILWALEQGVAVFGSASMGALRAAELHGFGMQGVGRIFEAYRDGLLKDDDEVALIHGPAELDYPALSEPMVNIRATLRRAEQDGVIERAACEAAEAHAKFLYFPERTWPTLLDHLARGFGDATRARCAEWLPEGRVDQKRDDACAMLMAMRDVAAPAPAFHFATTHHWAGLVARVAAEEEEIEYAARRVLDELRIGPQERMRAMRTQALLRFAGGEAGDPNMDPNAAVDALRGALGLHTRRTMEAWLQANDLSAADFAALAARSHRADDFARHASPRLSACLLDALRIAGDYPRLAARAADKAATLARHGMASGALHPDERVALRHGFTARRFADGHADLQGLLAATGFADAEALDEALRREHLYLTLARPTPGD